MSSAWTASPGVRYRNVARADPPNRTLLLMPRRAVIVWALIEVGGFDAGSPPLRLNVARARKNLLCCDGIRGRLIQNWELAGPVAGRGYGAIVRIYFGSKPTRRMARLAQSAVRRLRLPPPR
jgi:hypothetical protein